LPSYKVKPFSAFGKTKIASEGPRQIASAPIENMLYLIASLLKIKMLRFLSSGGICYAEPFISLRFHFATLKAQRVLRFQFETSYVLFWMLRMISIEPDFGQSKLADFGEPGRKMRERSGAAAILP
jgi:hypothetical protein